MRVALGLSISAACLAQAPPKPQGFATEKEVMTAVTAKTIPLIVVSPPPSPDVLVDKDIEFAKVGERSLTLDLYRPKDQKAPVPGIIVIHYGGWNAGSKTDMRVYGHYYAKLGYVAACISYRLTREAVFPAQLTDAKAAVRWMRANAAKYNIDPNHIGAAGSSSGAHLAMLLGYVQGVPELEGNYGNVGVDSRIQAVVEMYGPTDLTQEKLRKIGAVKRLIGGRDYEENKSAYEAASPLTYLTADDAPTILFQGSIDSIVPVEQAELLDAKLTELGIAHEYHRLDGWPHTMEIAQPVFDYCTWHIQAFLAKHLPLPK